MFSMPTSFLPVGFIFELFELHGRPMRVLCGALSVLSIDCPSSTSAPISVEPSFTGSTVPISVLKHERYRLASSWKCLSVIGPSAQEKQFARLICCFMCVDKNMVGIE